MKLEKVLFISDCHHPYNDKKAWALLLKAACVLKPDTCVILGDFADFYCVSSHDKSPKRNRSLDTELTASNKSLDILDKLGFKKKIFIAGNHEDRLERYLMTKAPELFETVRIEKLFKLKQRGWVYVPYKEHYKLGKLYLTHDTGKAGETAHTKALNDFQDNVCIGHTHRLGYQVVGNAKGKPHVAAMFGWLGDVKKVDYMHKIKAFRDWALGFGIGYITSSGIAYLTPVPIVNYTCLIEGQLISL